MKLSDDKALEIGQLLIHLFRDRVDYAHADSPRAVRVIARVAISLIRKAGLTVEENGNPPA